MRRPLPLLAALLMTIGGAPALVASQALASARAVHHPQVLLVCNGSTIPCPALRHQRQFPTIAAAVSKAEPGDWVLIWPGIYRESTPKWNAGVWIGKRDVHIRGLNRNKVIIDGSNGTNANPCPSAPDQQNFGAGGVGRNGIVATASGVTIQNLTVCNFLSGSGGNGNQIWWDGGYGSGKLGIGAYAGSYLTATSTYASTYSPTGTPNLAQYGIFSSNARGPGLISHSYAGNMADSAYYVGACQRECNTVLAHDRGTNSALGFSGTNAGGRLIIRDSVFDHNRTGLAPNSLNNNDAPPPQDGRCPGSRTRSCTIIEHNLIKANNRANVPTTGLEPAIGAGVELAGGKFDTVAHNVIEDQGAWGVVVHDYPDTEIPPKIAHCQGGIPNFPEPGICTFVARGNRVHGNTFIHDGFFGNTTNGDMGTVSLKAHVKPRNCFFGNVALARPGGHRVALTSSPRHIQRASVDGRPCGTRGTGYNFNLISQLICATGATGLGPCPAGSNYPKQTTIIMVPLPHLATMPHPCAGLPRNPYCP